MVQAVTFLNTELPNYGEASKVLRNNGWQAVRSTSGNRYTTFYKYYEYLASTRAAQLHTTVASLPPIELEPLHKQAQSEYGKYEMYVKDAPDLGAVLAPPNIVVPEEVFANEQLVEEMQPLYAEINSLMLLIGNIKLGGGKRKTRKHSKKSRSHRKSSKKTMRKRSIKRRN